MRTAVLLAALALAAMPPTAAAIEREMTVYLHEDPLHILPEEIHAGVGDVLKLTIENPATEGKTAHNFLVCGDGAKFSEQCDERWAFTGMIQPGESALLTVNVTKAGTFDYYCYIAGHKTGGMAGHLVVQEAGGGAKAVPFGPLALLALAGLALALRRRAA